MISNKYQSLVTRGIRRAAASAKLRRSCLTLVWTLGKWPRIVTVQKLAAQTLEEKHALQLRTASLWRPTQDPEEGAVTERGFLVTPCFSRTARKLWHFALITSSIRQLSGCTYSVATRQAPRLEWLINMGLGNWLGWLNSWSLLVIGPAQFQLLRVLPRQDRYGIRDLWVIFCLAVKIRFLRS